MQTSNEPLQSSYSKRQLNIELLRVVSMFMVLLIHYNLPVRGKPTLEAFHNDFTYTAFTIFMQSILIVCVNCFVLISGYFGIHWKKISFFNLSFQVIFWIIICYAVQMFVPHNGTSTFSAYLSEIFSKWFIWAYFGLYLIAPVLNAFIEKQSLKQITLFVILFYMYSTLFGYLTKAVADFNEGMSVISLAGLYILGSVIHKAEHRLPKSPRKWFFYYLLCTITLTILTFIAFSIGFEKMPQGYLNPIVLIESICLFMFFKCLHVRFNGILFFSSSAYAVYLFHILPFDCYTIPLQYIVNQSHPMYLEFIFIISYIVIVYLVAILIDKIRIKLFNITAVHENPLTIS